jgi:hypothetical protein
MSDVANEQVDTAQNLSNPQNIPAPDNGAAPPAQSGDSGTPPGDTPAEEPKRNGDGGFQRRINRLTREKHEALGRLDALERENAEIRERLSRSSTPQHRASDQEPRQDQFQRYEDFVAARAEYRAEQKVRQIAEEIRQSAQANNAEQSQQQRIRSFESKLATQGKGIEDFDEVMEGIRDPALSISQAMGEYLMDDSDNTALLAKWLTDNPDEAARISRLRPTAAVKELAKVDAQLGSKPAPRTTKAPPPVSTVGGSAAPSGGMPKTTDINEWMKWRAQQD